MPQQPTNLLLSSGPFTSERSVPRIVGPNRETHGAYYRDESKLEAKSVLSIAFPETVQEVSAILAFLADTKEPVYFSGSRTGVVGGSFGPEPGHLVSLEKLKGIRLAEIDGKPVVVAGAGETLAAMNAILAEQVPGLFFPVDPTETSASVGGMVSTNAGGARSYRYGSVRKWVRAIKVVLADGSVLSVERGIHRADGGTFRLRSGGQERSITVSSIPKPNAKNSIGYAFTENGDLIDLFIGAEGTLGAVVEVTFDLIPRPDARLYVMQFFPSAEAALKFVTALRDERGIEPLAIEFLDPRSIEIARTSGIASTNRLIRLLRPTHQAAVYTELVLSSEDELEAVFETLEKLLASFGVSMDEGAAGTEDKDLAEIKAFRHTIPETINGIIARRREQIPELHKLSTDMAVPDTDLLWVYNLYRETLERAGLEFAIFGHAGNNHLHVNILPRSLEELVRAKELYRHFGEEIVKRGGSVAGEHGIGQIKLAFLSIQYPPEVLVTLRSIKNFFDPNWILSPGVLLERA